MKLIRLYKFYSSYYQFNKRQIIIFLTSSVNIKKSFILYPNIKTINKINFLYRIGFSFFPAIKASKDTPLTLTTFHRTPGRSPIALPFAPPIPSTITRSCSSMKFSAPYPDKVELTTLYSGKEGGNAFAVFL